MATMSGDPYVYHVPTMAGGVGRDDVRAFYSGYFIGHWPQDTNITPISRTSGENQVVDELVVSFTHDIEMQVFLPGVAPTGRKIELAIVVVVAFEEGKVSHEHIYWDQASLLVQAGLLDASAVPAVGAEQSRWLVDRSPKLNELLTR
jgi:carboxymethylenebutenolidase